MKIFDMLFKKEPLSETNYFDSSKIYAYNKLIELRISSAEIDRYKKYNQYRATKQSIVNAMYIRAKDYSDDVSIDYIERLLDELAG